MTLALLVQSAIVGVSLGSIYILMALGLTLMAGASLVLVDRFHADETLDVIKDHGVTLVAGAPTMYAALAALPDSEPDAMPRSIAKAAMANSTTIDTATKGSVMPRSVFFLARIPTCLRRRAWNGQTGRGP